MISQLTTAKETPLVPEDTDICCGIYREKETGEFRTRPNKLHAYEVGLMQRGDRADFALMLSLID